MRILIVEDEDKIAELIADVLEGEGLIPEIARDGEEGWFLGSTESYAAAILDIEVNQVSTRSCRCPVENLGRGIEECPQSCRI